MAKVKLNAKVAVVNCNGGCRAKESGNYIACEWGCVGCTICDAVCKFGAIHQNEYGVAEVDEDKCLGCGRCVKVCPRQVISLHLKSSTIRVLCSNEQKGKDARLICDVSCIGCGICAKKCPADAIEVIDNHAVINEDLCLLCGMCAVNCPRHAIIDKTGILTPIR